MSAWGICSLKAFMESSVCISACYGIADIVWYTICVGMGHYNTGEAAVGQRPCAELGWAVMAFPGAQLLGLGVRSRYVGRKCSLARVRVVATTGMFAQWSGGLRRMAQVCFDWCMTVRHARVSFWLSVVCIYYLPFDRAVVVQCGARVEAGVVPMWCGGFANVCANVVPMWCHCGSDVVPMWCQCGAELPILRTLEERRVFSPFGGGERASGQGGSITGFAVGEIFSRRPSTIYICDTCIPMYYTN